MDKYKEVVRKRIRGVTIATLFVVTFVICMHFFVIKSAYTEALLYEKILKRGAYV